MSIKLKALSKKTGLLLAVYALLLGSINTITPFLFSQKASAWTKDITSIISSPSDVSTTYGQLVDIHVTAKEGDNPGWIGYDAGKIKATVEGGVVMGGLCSSVTDWTGATNVDTANIASSIGILEWVITKGYVNADFCYKPTTVSGTSPFVVKFTSDFPCAYWDEDEDKWITECPLDPVDTKVTVAPLKLTITDPVITLSKVYDGNTDVVVAGGVPSGMIFGDDVTVITKAKYDNQNVGDNKTITVSYELTGTDAGKYTAPDSTTVNNGVITPKPITITAQPKVKVYGEADPELTYEYPYVDLVGTDVFTGALVRDAGENVGAYIIKRGTLDNPNYNITFVSDDLTITQRPITITADNKTKVAGEIDPALTYTVTAGSLVAGDVLGGSIARVAGETAAQYEINAGTLNNPNYLIAFNNGVFTITAAPVVPSNNTNITTGGTSATTTSTETADVTTEPEAEVAGAETTEGEISDSANSTDTKDTTEVKSATDTKKKAWGVLGLAWYWWLLIILIILILRRILLSKPISDDDTTSKK